MRLSTLLPALAATLVSSKEMPKDEVRAAELYDSGVMHEKIMAEKKEKGCESITARSS